MGQPVRKHLLLAPVCFLEGLLAVVYFAHAAGGFTGSGAEASIGLISKCALAAGICAVAAEPGHSADAERWFVTLHGVSLTLLGLILSGVFGSRISLRAIASVMVLLAASSGALALLTARAASAGHHQPGVWLNGLTGAALTALAFFFLLLVFIRLPAMVGSAPELLASGACFVLSAVCMLGHWTPTPRPLRIAWRSRNPSRLVH